MSVRQVISRLPAKRIRAEGLPATVARPKFYMLEPTADVRRASVLCVYPFSRTTHSGRPRPAIVARPIFNHATRNRPNQMGPIGLGTIWCKTPQNGSKSRRSHVLRPRSSRARTRRHEVPQGSTGQTLKRDTRPPINVNNAGSEMLRQ